MTDISNLAGGWRRKARELELAGEHIRAHELRKCAADLEEAWHAYAHDAEWADGCLICEEEMLGCEPA